MPRAGFWRQNLKPGGRRWRCWSLLSGAVGLREGAWGIRSLIWVPARFVSLLWPKKTKKPASPLKAVSVGRGGDGQPSAVSGGGERLRCSGGSRAFCPRWSLSAPRRQGEGTRSSAGGSSPAPSRGLRGPASGAARPSCPRLKFPSLESRWSYFTGILLFWKMFRSLWHIVSASSLSPQVVAVLTKIYWMGIVTRCLCNSPLLTAQPLATRD